MGLFLVIRILLLSCLRFVTLAKVEIDIVILASDSPDLFTSLEYFRPVFDLATEVANNGQGESAAINLVYLNVAPSIPCQTLLTETGHLLADWYYKKRRPTTKAVSIIMPMGMFVGSQPSNCGPRENHYEDVTKPQC